MLRKHIKKIIIIVIVIAITGVTMTFLLPIVSQKNAVIEDPYYTETGEYKNKELAPYISVLGELQRMGLGTDKYALYWENWDWQKQMIYGDIVEVNLDTYDLILEFSDLPKDKPYTNKMLRVTVNCPLEQTVAVSETNPTQSLTDVGFILFDHLQKGDGLFTYCLDEECMNLGKTCVLVKSGK